MATVVFRDFEPWYAVIEQINLDNGSPFTPQLAQEAGWEAEAWRQYFDGGYLPEQAFDVALDVLNCQLQEAGF